MSGATGISTNVLRALEDEDRGQLPAEVYVRAFYKKYAGFLGVETEEILAVYQEQDPHKNRSGSRFHFSTKVKLKGREGSPLAGITGKLLPAVIIVLGGALLFWIYKNYLAPYNPFDF